MNLFKCECSSHLLEVSKDEEFNQYYFSFWTLNPSYRLNFKQRLKSAWKMLWQGRLFESDGVILSQEEVKNLIEVLKKYESEK